MIYCVEDDSSIRELMVYTLQASGFEACGFQDAAAFWNMMKEKPDISQEALGENMGVTRRVVQKYINVLKEAGRIERVGGKRYGHWKIND